MNINCDDFIKERLLLILGFGTSLVLELRRYAPKDREKDILWFIQAMENVVYQNKPLPPFPER
jgi:hypothetical protein